MTQVRSAQADGSVGNACCLLSLVFGVPHTARNCCVQNLGVGGSQIGIGTGNTGADPFLANLNSGDLRLQLGSSCIDAGNRLVDIDAALPGTQPLRPTDIAGNPRVVDGDDDGSAEVDIGALESAARTDRGRPRILMMQECGSRSRTPLFFHKIFRRA